MIGYALRGRFRPELRLALLAFAGLGLAAWLGGFILVFPICGGYLTLYLALETRLPRLKAARFGDLSYGLYIYGWPVEQAVLRFAGPMPWWALFGTALPVAAAIALLSWHLVEQPAMRLKPRGRERSGFPPGDPVIDPLLQQVERQRAVIQHEIVERADVEATPQPGLGARP
jgi:peptidoglycan/LPS O-acetylase OafA/YrhL